MNLRELREAAGITQQELGALLNVELGGADEPEYFQPRISSYETGRNTMPLPVALALVKVLNQKLKAAKVKARAKVEDMMRTPAPKRKKPRR